MLEDALKYEGDTMGHCVGGYCGDVLSGRTRIFSLRDAKGQPHVTVEVVPQGWFQTANNVPDPTGEFENFHRLVQNRRVGDGDYEDVARKLAAEHEIETPLRIVQIKGKQNRKPNDEYLPFVQDFVRNSPLGQPWSEVGDLQNTGLTKHKTGRYITDAEASSLYEKHFGRAPDSAENAWQYANRIGRYDKNILTEIDVDFLKDWDAGNFGELK